jgi:hypothetical protein
MRFRFALPILLGALVAADAWAEEMCGQMMRTVTRFRGRVISVERAGRRAVRITPIDSDPRFVVSIEVESVEKNETYPLAAGETWHFGVRDVAQMFGTRRIAGKTLELETEWMECGGAMRRFVDMRALPRGRMIEEFTGWLELGHSYRAQARWDAKFGVLTLEPNVRPPYHHHAGVEWVNLDDFPALPRDGTAFAVVFEHVRVETTHLSEREWLSMYELKLVDAR